MPWRLRFSSFVILGAALSLAACSKADWRDATGDWRVGVERPEDCIERMNTLSGELVSQPAAQTFRWVPVFRFDVTKMGKEAVDELVASAGAHVLTPLERGVSGAGGELPAALLYRDRDRLLLRLRDRRVAMANVTAAGCALQWPDMRLIDWHMQPPPK